MFTFAYQALNPDGEPATGQIAAESTAAAVAQLESQGMVILSINMLDSPTLKSADGVEEAPGDSAGSPSADEALLIERLQQLIDQRETLVPALLASSSELPAGQSRRDLRLLADLLSRSASTDEIRNSPPFLRSWLPLVAGGADLDAEHQLQGMFSEAMQARTIRRQWVRSLVYPVLVCLLALAVLVFLLALIVPSFADIFSDFDLDLPAMTLALIQFTDLLLGRPHVLLLWLVGLWLLWRVVKWIASLWRFPGRVLGIFTTGNSRQLAAMASFVRTLGEALQVGLRPPAALRLAGEETQQPWIREEADALAAALESERTETESSNRTSRLPATLQYALRAETPSGPNIPLVQQLAEMYCERLQRRLDWSSGFVSIVAILAVGLVVAFVAIALFLPLVELITGLTG